MIHLTLKVMTRVVSALERGIQRIVNLGLCKEVFIN